jgi:1-acyl-sn-glycerol-3-phosphate acyltransferase
MNLPDRINSQAGDPGDVIARRPSRLMRALGSLVLGLIGWRSEGYVPNLARFITCVAPHTSNWDVVVCAGFMFREQLRLSFLAKHTLFFWPLGALMRWLGALPVDRKTASGIVGSVIEGFAQSEQLIIALAPEGTRTANARFKAGFLHMAIGAKVPILLVTLDNARKVIKLGELFTPSGDIDADIAFITAYYAPFQTHRAAPALPPA